MPKGKGRTTIFTNPFKRFKAKEEAIVRAGGAKPRKRIRVSPTIKRKKK
jgi:hypothetical protein